MFDFGKYKRREHGLVISAIGVGILFAVLLPPWGWMIACALGLITIGVYLFKKY